MDKDALFTKGTFGEVRALFLRMEELTLFIFEVAVRKESTLNFLLVFSFTFCSIIC